MGSGGGPLGNHITRLLYERQLTDEALAQRAGISRAQLNRIRNRHAIPRVMTAIAIARALGCRVREAFFLRTDSSMGRRHRNGRHSASSSAR